MPEAPADQLATVWSEWISYRLASEHYSISDCRFSVDSQINDSGYSQTVNPEKLEKILKNLDTSNERWKESLRMARKHVLTNIEEKQSVKLVKGKWLPKFIIHKVRLSQNARENLPTISNDHFLTACLRQIDFHAAWQNYYGEKVGFALN